MNEHTKCTREEDGEGSCKSGETRRNETTQTRANAKYSRYPKTVDNPVPVENLSAWIFFLFKLYFHFKIKLLFAKYFQFYRFLFLGLSLKILLKNASFFVNFQNCTLEIYFVNFSIIIYYYLLIINKKYNKVIISINLLIYFNILIYKIYFVLFVLHFIRYKCSKK